jgi:hypothetical protein
MTKHPPTTESDNKQHQHDRANDPRPTARPPTVIFTLMTLNA